MQARRRRTAFVKREIGMFELVVFVKLIDEFSHLIGLREDDLQIFLFVGLAYKSVFYSLCKALNYRDRRLQIMGQACKHTLFVPFESKTLFLTCVENVHHLVETIVKMLEFL